MQIGKIGLRRWQIIDRDTQRRNRAPNIGHFNKKTKKKKHESGMAEPTGEAKTVEREEVCRESKI